MPLQALADRDVDQNILDGRAPSVGALFRSRVRATPDAPAYLYFADGVERAHHPDVAADPRGRRAVGRRAHQPRGAAGGPRRHRLDDPRRVDPRRPRRHLRRGRDDDRLPDDDRRGRRLHPHRLGQRHRLRRERGAGRQAPARALRGARRAAGHRPDGTGQRGRLGHHDRPARRAWSRVAGRDARPRRLAHRPARARVPRRRHLHVRHDRPPQGRAPRRRTASSTRAPSSTRSARSPGTTSSSSGCRSRTSSARCSSRRGCRSASRPPSTAVSTRSSRTWPSSSRPSWPVRRASSRRRTGASP